MKNIPLVIPVFNQLTYLKNLILWWKWYHPENPVYIVDNGSDYEPLKDYYNSILSWVYPYGKNEFIPNLNDFIAKHIKGKYEYYVLSDPDIYPHPNTPPNFLEIWRDQIDNHGYHRAGFNLITKDIPEWLNEKEMILYNEGQLLNTPVMSHGPFMGYKAPIDTTFCLYKVANGGWSSPMNGKDWGNCIRLFDAFHLGWYIDGDRLNPEMEHYFKTSKYRVPGEPSAGKNNNRPKQFQ